MTGWNVGLLGCFYSFFPPFEGWVFSCAIFFWLSRRQHNFFELTVAIFHYFFFIGHLETTYIFWKPITLIPFSIIMHRVWYMYIIYIYFPPLYLYHSQSLSTLKYLPQNYQKSWEKEQLSTEKVPQGDVGGIYGDMWSFPGRVSPPSPSTEAGPPPTRKPYKENLEDFKAMQAPKGWKIHGKPTLGGGAMFYEGAMSLVAGWVYPKHMGEQNRFIEFGWFREIAMDMYWLNKKMPKILVESQWSNLECQGMRSLSSNWSTNQWKWVLFHRTTIDYIILDEVRHGIRTFISSRGLTYL